MYWLCSCVGNDCRSREVSPPRSEIVDTEFSTLWAASPVRYRERHRPVDVMIFQKHDVILFFQEAKLAQQVTNIPGSICEELSQWLPKVFISLKEIESAVIERIILRKSRVDQR